MYVNLSCTILVHCNTRITVTSTGFAENWQTKKMGMYTLLRYDDESNAIYENKSNGQYLYKVKAKRNVWFVSLT